ncbi:serine/threonine protein kinase [Streptomyces sp. DSM 110735]|uniref:serine/threonine protein kinase n=1 Tax=Streptomyces sp. DSM 110735 TaxID=2775031 RepID=UPI0018F71B11|nr:serine/threonine-protein kinase [Streptomyces sp. DSM 110735]MBJ7907423.1 serine/threonine protein kinase [Streptomyces sp. DSM 110735]
MAMAEAYVVADELVAGRFRLLEVFARETGREWWRAEDVRENRACLVTRTALPSTADQDTLRRTRSRVVRTSETMRLLCPGGVAAVIDAVVEPGTLWTAVQWIDGTPLTQLLEEEGPFDPVRAAGIGLEVLDVLRTAHEEGITHGELSPGQIFVRDGGTVVLAGFGLAGTTLAPRVAAPSYASPEQARDERIGPAADLWALGAILYTMTEGRPPFRDRGRTEATLRAVTRLPLRAPLRTGPLTRTVEGLLRKNSRERLTRPVVRASLVRVLEEDAGAYGAVAAAPVSEGEPEAAPPGGSPLRSRRALAAGVCLAVAAVVAAALAVAHQSSEGVAGARPSGAAASAETGASAGVNPGTGSGTATAPSRSTAAPGKGTTAAPTSHRTRSQSAPAPGTSAALPAGFRTYTAPEGFSLALPVDWKREGIRSGADHSFRVTFGPGDSSLALAVTYSESVGSDPVAVWRDDVEPGLAREDGYQRVGAIEATEQQGRPAADMEWLSGTGQARTHTFGRGFLLGGGRGYSLRFTTPAADWDEPDNQAILRTALRTFRA